VTSRELVRRTLDFDGPPRVPRQIWILPWAEAHHSTEVAHLRAAFPDDVVAAPVVHKRPLDVVGNRYARGTYVDEWGCRFENAHGGVIGIPREPLIAKWADLEWFRTPDAALDLDTGAIDAFCRSTDRWVIGGTWVRPFERLGFLRTMEQALVDLVERPPELLELLARIHRHYLREVEIWAATAIDAISLMDDWGGQQSMLVSPRVFRELFKPLYREYADVAHARGKRVFMHSDGHILEIIPDLIEIGIDALNSQVACMGVPALGERFRGRITFWGEIDRQQLLPHGTMADVRRAVSEQREHLWAGGGVIAECEFGPGARPENVAAVFDAWDQVGGGTGAGDS